jgi:3-methyladenine DNA glycosylase AlkD
MDAEAVIKQLKGLANRANVEGMARFGISTHRALGIGHPELHQIAGAIRKELRRSPEEAHALAAELWTSGIHEARQVAIMLEVPSLVTPAQMDAWVADVDSWDIGDGLSMGLFDRTPYAVGKALEWAHREEEFVRRAAFALMAALAFKRHSLGDEVYEQFFALMKLYATDERNFVNKGVNWALRQIGKRNERLLSRSIAVAEEIDALDSRSARWIAKDALRELRPRAAQARITSTDATADPGSNRDATAPPP